jgi:hypothetical protein
VLRTQDAVLVQRTPPVSQKENCLTLKFCPTKIIYLAFSEINLIKTAFIPIKIYGEVHRVNEMIN